MAILRRFRESRNANIGKDNDGEKTRSRADRQSWRTTYPLVVTWTQESGKVLIEAICPLSSARSRLRSPREMQIYRWNPDRRRNRASDGHVSSRSTTSTSAVDFPFSFRSSSCAGGTGSRRTEFQPSQPRESSYQNATVHRDVLAAGRRPVSRNSCVLADPFFAFVSPST